MMVQSTGTLEDFMAAGTNKLRVSFMNIIPSAVVTQALASAGADAIVIDQEHAPIGPENLHAMIASTAGTKCLPFVRVTNRDEAMVKLALDFGAAGIVFPLTSTAEEAAECVAMTRYPPLGRRAFGTFVAHSRWGQSFEESLTQLSNTARCNLLIETKAAIENIDAICAVPGISTLVLAGFDLSVDLGCPGRFDAPEFLAAVEKFERAATAANVPMSTAALTQEQVKSAAARGYSGVLLGFDILMLKNAAATAISWLDS
jgi:4-hydroxy-2-oxoheptanedioate aldolase